MTRWLAALAALPLAVPAAAQDDKPAWVGVWAGTVGRSPVRLCIDTWGDGNARGAYYYLSVLEPIALSDYDSEQGWTESAPDGGDTADWVFTEQSATALRGNWRRQRVVHPFALAPVAWTEGEWGGPCSSEAFLGPRLGGGSVVDEPAVHEGWRYTKRIYRPAPQFAEDVEVESFSFAPERRGDAAINAELAAYLPREMVDDAFVQCSAGNLSSFGHDGGFYQHVAPRMVTGRFITVAEANDTYCGGAHPSTWTTYRTFDRETGQEVDLDDWIGPPVGEDEAAPLPDGLRQAVLARWPSDYESVEEEEQVEGCRESVASTAYWTLELAIDGISFTPDLPRVVMACTDSVLLDWDALAPFLDAEGRAGLARLRGG